MKRKEILFVIILMATASCKKQDSITIDLSYSPIEVELLGEKIISTGLYERDMAITPDGKEIMYTIGDYKQQKRCLIQHNYKDGNWTPGKVINISGKYQDIEPFYADDGNSLYFASNRPIAENDETSDYNIWHSKRTENGWDTPTPLNTNINTEGDEFYPSLSENGNLYFTATKKEGIGREDIFVSRKVKGIYQEPEVLDTMINTPLFEFNAFISPEEDLLIFSSYGRSDDMGDGDLYYSRKDSNGRWTPSKNMGESINSEKLDYCPFIDMERKNFFFTSDRAKEAPTNIDRIEVLKNFANNPQNGMGDIYRIGLDQLNLN